LAEWIPELQAQLNNLKIVYQLWLWGAQGVIEIIPDLPVEIAPAKPKVTPKTSFNIPVKNICSEVQYLTIEKILTHIVGPVAPCFLATSLNASRDSKTLFKNILERLSFEQRREFERQAEITLSQELEIPTTRSIAIEQKTVSQGSATTQLSIAHTSNSHEFIGRDCSGLTTEQYNYLESLLLELIGPIAPTLLKYYNENSPSIDDLIKSCKEHLNARQQEYFENKIKALPINRTRQQITVEQLKPQTRSGSAFTVLQIEDTFNKQRLIDRETAEECQRYLVNLIGPIAKYIVVDIISKNPAISIERFIELIAAEIPDPKQVEALRQKFLRF
jgi:hypothetical protein